MMQIKRVAVLGSGVMGAAIAAHLANCGTPSLMLDMVPRDLPEGWQATNVEVAPGERPVWGVSLLTDDQRYVGIRQDQIPRGGRIVAVADVFDALTQKRPYKAAWPLSEAIAEIERQRTRQFDPEIVDAFLRVIEQKSPHVPV